MVARALAVKGGAELVKQVVALDASRRELIRKADDLKADRNRASEAIGQAKEGGEDASAEMARMADVGDRIKGLDAELKQVDVQRDAVAAQLPNVPDERGAEGRGADADVDV